jgi:hypothetical protein
VNLQVFGGKSVLLKLNNTGTYVPISTLVVTSTSGGAWQTPKR